MILLLFDFLKIFYVSVNSFLLLCFIYFGISLEMPLFWLGSFLTFGSGVGDVCSGRNFLMQLSKFYIQFLQITIQFGFIWRQGKLSYTLKKISKHFFQNCSIYIQHLCLGSFGDYFLFLLISEYVNASKFFSI